MTTTRRSRNGLNGSADQSHRLEDALEDDPPLDPAATPEDDDVLRAVVERVQRQAQSWRDALSISIGRARALTDLEETKIRYFEELGALQPTKSTDQAGASRLYTLSDLRCLYALALLVKEYGYRPAEAASFVKGHRELIQSGSAGSLAELLRHEGSAITDGFILARLMSQLLDVARLELNRGHCDAAADDVAPSAELNAGDRACLRITGLIAPMRSLFSLFEPPSAEDVRRRGLEICRAPMNMLVALDRGALLQAPTARIPKALGETGRNDTTVLFYSPEAWEIPHPERHAYCAYIPHDHPHRTIIFMIAAEGSENIPHILLPKVSARAVLFDRILAMCELIFDEFRNTTLAKNYRYRSDGFQIEQTQEAYHELLGRLNTLIFPNDPASIAAILLPDSLDRPTSLSILAHHGYDAELAPRVKLDLTGEGQGLCGRAYKLREPFFSQHADPRIAYAMEEHCQVALAIPFTASWGIAPFGVIYLASRDPARTLSGDVAYIALILGNILSEMVGRWWLTRRRRSLDLVVHQDVEAITHWFDSLDAHSPDLRQALRELQSLWERIEAGQARPLDSRVALVVFDIDTFRRNVQLRSNEPVPLKAQVHVRAAMRKILPDTRDYWFKNDHALLILYDAAADQAVSIARRIANQVRALPPDIQGDDDKSITISVSAAIKFMTYQDLHDLDRTGKQRFIDQIDAIVDDQRRQLSRVPAQTLLLFTSRGWETI